ncbi:MAG: hypothetical protein LBS34_00395 [Rickettsiales bacterium]|jgi:hypothetical protein|nr:hypothetical protein [Rickettsiales bacterium]
MKARNEFEEKLSESMKTEFNEYLTKEFCLTTYHTDQAFVDDFSNRLPADARNFVSG